MMVLITKSGPGALPLGSDLPDFENLSGTDGQTYSLSHFQQAKALVVVFTCNHCPYAVAYEDRLIALAQEFEAQEVGFVAISANDAENYPADSFEKMQQRAQEKGFPFPYLYDQSQAVAKAYHAICTPHVFVGDSARKLVYRGRIDDSWRDPSQVKVAELKDALLALVQDNPVPVGETNPMGCSIKWRY